MTSRHPIDSSLLEWARRTDNPRLMQIIQRYLDGLRRSLDGDELYGLISRILRRHSQQGPIGAACFTELHSHLDTYARDPVATPSARIKARLLQQHIAPYLADNGQRISESVSTGTIDVPYRQVTPAGATSLKEGTLHARLSAAQERRQRYEALHRSEQDAWHAIYGVMRDFTSLKQLWTQSYDDMSAERDRLEQRLVDTEQTLQSVEASARQLKSDLDAVRQAPARKTTRRVPRLPRAAAARLVPREMFLQQIQVEVSRLRRSGGSAALVMLRVDRLDAVTRQYGEGAESAVLACYTREILSGFRAYDVASRYDDDLFAVLLPDTGQDGAVRALEKAQNRAAGTHVAHNEQRFALPGFRAALTLYAPGEEPASWLKRSEHAIGDSPEPANAELII